MGVGDRELARGEGQERGGERNEDGVSERNGRRVEDGKW